MRAAQGHKVGSTGATIVSVVAIVGGVYLTAKGMSVPPWLATILTLVGTGAGWIMFSPFQKRGA